MNDSILWGSIFLLIFIAVVVVNVLVAVILIGTWLARSFIEWRNERNVGE